MQSVFKIAIFQRPPIVLGRQLLPLSHWHEMVLMASESPYAGDTDTANLDNLAFAVAVCSQTWEQGSAWFASPDLFKVSHKWGKGKRKADFGEAHAAFVKYLSESRVQPDHEHLIGKVSQPCQHPWPMLNAVALFEKLGESRAWNCPIALGSSYLSCMVELAGNRTLKDEVYYARLAEQKAYMEEQRLKMEAKKKESQ